MNEEEGELLFLSRLYETWPWCYDSKAIIEQRGKIINLQHRKIAKMQREKDLIQKYFTLTRKNKSKNKRKKLIKKEFPQEMIIKPHNAK